MAAIASNPFIATATSNPFAAAAAYKPTAPTALIGNLKFSPSGEKGLGIRPAVIVKDLDTIALFLRYCPKEAPVTFSPPAGYTRQQTTVKAKDAKIFDVWKSPKQKIMRFDAFIALMGGEQSFRTKILTQGPVVYLTKSGNPLLKISWREGPAFAKFPVQNYLELRPETHTSLSKKQECLGLAPGTKVMIHSFDIGSLSWKTKSFKIPEEDQRAGCDFYKLPFELLGESLFIETPKAAVEPPRRTRGAALLGRFSRILPSIVRR